MQSSFIQTTPTVQTAKKTIWIDLENSPHVPFFRPVVRELETLGYRVLITARDYAQTLELAEHAGLDYISVGRHYGKHTLAKASGLLIRTAQLASIIMRQKVDLAVSHGSRSLFVLAGMLRIPSITIMDYEHARWTRLPKFAWLMAPEAIPEAAFTSKGVRPGQLLRYPGIKEDVYAPSFHPQQDFKAQLGIDKDALLVTVRPPADEAHYFNPMSQQLLVAVLNLLAAREDVTTILAPRTAKQGEQLHQQWPEAFSSRRFRIPAQVVNGLDLIWNSELVISGGGTMNREAAALGVPVYSIFRGPTGAVDKKLEAEGRLVMLTSEQDVLAKLAIALRPRMETTSQYRSPALHAVVENILKVLEG